MTRGEANIVPVNGSDLEDSFPGYYRPSAEEREVAYTTGLVCLDANALLDLYRFTPNARNELFRILDLLKNRIFVPHQAALEFHDNRLGVVDERIKAIEEECSEIEKLLTSVSERVRGFANRHQIEDAQKRMLTGMVESLSASLTNAIGEAGAYDLDRPRVADATDPVLTRLSPLFRGRIGRPMTDDERREAVKEADRRRADKIPPGYEDKKKTDPSERSGDYVLWRQILTEAAVHKLPVLFVCNETKVDWVRKSKNNEILGPRPELVLEMKQAAQVQLHTVTVVGLLKEAPKFLGAIVSPSTIKEAELFPGSRSVVILFSERTKEQIRKLSGMERAQMRDLLERYREGLHQFGMEYLSKTNSRTVIAKASGVYLIHLRWPGNEAMMEITVQNGDNSEEITMKMLDLFHRQRDPE